MTLSQERDTVKADEFEDVTPLDQTAIDPYGRRSMAYRQESTGKIVTYTEIMERSPLEPDTRDSQIIMRRFHRRFDVLMCWTLFEHTRPQILRSALRTLCVPFMFLYIGYMWTSFKVDCWRAG